MVETPKTNKEVDIYRDTPIRLLGYANEVGESFRSKIGTKWVLATYILSTAYVMADTLDKAIRMYQKSKLEKDCFKKTTYTAADAFIWQMLASVFVPGFTINRVCAVSSNFLKKNRNITQKRRELYVIGIGLSTIPFIIKPIDHYTDKFMDYTFRKLLTID